ncbi:helix-turn-helix domain-containing protein [Ferrimicrobium sp.]|uniref:helix-turn-helix domain-containing protein n=1 Tax=Ferrimicrobium sp. TaxID=2926050 RepID=UPI00261235B5|nr:helix-turn-helix domain-containing protein [Ferrimicrobium sp.]
MRAADQDKRPLLTVEETALLLGLPVARVYRSIHRKDFPLKVFVINGRFCIARAEVVRFINGEL